MLRLDEAPKRHLHLYCNKQRACTSKLTRLPLGCSYLSYVGTSFVSTTPSGSSTYAAGTWTIGILNNAANETLDLVCNVDTGTANTTITNSVVNTDVTQTQDDSITANEDVSQDITINNETDIAMALAVDDSTPNEGQSVTYTYTASNNGPAQASSLAVASANCPTLDRPLTQVGHGL